MQLGRIPNLLITMHMRLLRIRVRVVFIAAGVNFLTCALLILTVHAIVMLLLILLMHLGVIAKHMLGVAGLFTLFPILFTPLAETTTLQVTGVTVPVIKMRHTSAEGL